METGNNVTNNEFFEEFQEYEKDHVAPVTRVGRIAHLKMYFLPHMGERMVSSIGVSDIDGIYDYLESAGYAKNTLFSVYATLLSFFKVAVERGFISDNPVSRARRIYPEKGGMIRGYRAFRRSGWISDGGSRA